MKIKISIDNVHTWYALEVAIRVLIAYCLSEVVKEQLINCYDKKKMLNPAKAGNSLKIEAVAAATLLMHLKSLLQEDQLLESCGLAKHKMFLENFINKLKVAINQANDGK